MCLDCHHGLAIQSVSAPPCHTGREGGRHNQRNTGSHAARSRGRRVLSIPDSPEAAPGASVAAGFTFQVKNQASHWPITSLDKKKKKSDKVGVILEYQLFTRYGIILQEKTKGWTYFRVEVVYQVGYSYISTRKSNKVVWAYCKCFAFMCTAAGSGRPTAMEMLHSTAAAHRGSPGALAPSLESGTRCSPRATAMSLPPFNLTPDRPLCPP